MPCFLPSVLGITTTFPSASTTAQYPSSLRSIPVIFFAPFLLPCSVAKVSAFCRARFTVSLSSYNFKTKEIKQLKDSIDSGGYFCKNKYFTAIEVGKVYENDYGPHYQDIVVQNEKFETIKEIFKHVSDEHATPIYNFSNSKVQVSDGSKYYLLDCETYELTEMNSLYRIITMYE